MEANWITHMRIDMHFININEFRADCMVLSLDGETLYLPTFDEYVQFTQYNVLGMRQIYYQVFPPKAICAMDVIICIDVI